MIKNPGVLYKYIIVLITMLASAGNLSAQFYITGQPPASVKWKQINTEYFKLIYPETFSSQAFRLAGLLEDSRDLTSHTLGHRPAKIPVLVHNHNSRSNGLVVWAPKRMELYTTPPQSAPGGEWLQHLAVHEQRHVVQIDKMNKGLTKFAFHLFGEQASGIALGQLPFWFLEGDAVLTETTLTHTGRGRTASFEMPLRALLLSEKERYSYDKYLFGSYKDYVPDHYQYGYQLVSTLRQEYGPEIWANTIDHLARWPIIPGAFTRSLRNQTGSGLEELHEIVLTRIGKEWENAPEEIDAVSNNPEIINRRTDEVYHNYRYPVWVGDSAIISLKSGLAQVSELVKLDMKGNEESLIYTGQLSAPVLSFSGSRIAWSEFKSDIRWGLRQFSVIKIYDTHTGTERRISSGSRYFAPAFAPDGLFLAVIEVDPENRNSIILINSVTGEEARRYPGKEGKNLQQPSYSKAGNEILVTSVCTEGTGIMALDLNTGEWRDLVAPSFVNISGVFECDDMVCFHSDISGIDNLYATTPGSGRLYHVSNSLIGAFEGNISDSGTKMVFSEYSAGGYNLAVSDFDISTLSQFEETSYFSGDKMETLVSHEKGLMPDKYTSVEDWRSRPYRKGLHLFRFHSWAPFYYDYKEFNIHEQPVYPGVTLLSQNLLGTANTILGYSYQKERHIVHGNFTYRGWYPVIEAGFDFGGEPMVFQGRDSIGAGNLAQFKSLNLNGTVSVPLNLSGGNHIAGIEPHLSVIYNNSLYHYDRENTYKRGMTILQSRFLVYRYQRRSMRDLAPEWGQVLRWQRRSAPFESENLGVINALEMTLYFPGISRHHSLRVDAAIQSQEMVKYSFSGLINIPEGYPRQSGERLQVLKSRYSFPLIYPDLAVPGILYLKRVHGGLFADGGINSYRKAAEGSNRTEWHREELFSWGGSVTSNFHLFRFVAPINMTTGFAHIPSRNKFEFIFSVALDLGVF
jgi:Tol biopolymer transport system component